MLASTRFLLALILFLVVNELSLTNAFHVPEGSAVRAPPNKEGVLITAPTNGFKSSGFFKQRSKYQTLSTTLKLSQKPISGEDTVVIARDYRVAGIFLLGAAGLAQIPLLKFILAPLAGLLGLLFLVQTFRLQFVCDDEAFELLNTSKASGENIIVGGQNRWTYDSFVNYEFFPKGWIDQPQGPILVYFKETQTPKDKWGTGPGAAANSEKAWADGAVPGQAHFFPALCNTQQLRAEWEKRGCSKLE